MPLVGLALAALALTTDVVEAQVTSVNTSGGPVLFTVTGFNGVQTLTPLVSTSFQLFLEAVGNTPRQVLFEQFGTTFRLGPNGTVEPNTDFGHAGTLNLGSFAHGTPLVFSLVTDGGTKSTTGFYFSTTDGYQLTYAQGSGNDGPSEAVVRFTLSGVSSLTNPVCTIGNSFRPCVDANANITATPEPNTLALLVTGFVGLLGMAFRNKLAAT